MLLACFIMVPVETTVDIFTKPLNISSSLIIHHKKEGRTDNKEVLSWVKKREHQCVNLTIKLGYFN